MRSRCLSNTMLITMLLLVIATGFALCDTNDIVYVPTSSYPTIQAGIDGVSVGGTVIVSPGHYSGAGNYDITYRGKNITVRSSGGPGSTFIDLTQGSYPRAFAFENYETSAARLEGFTIRYGNCTVSSMGDVTGGAIKIRSASPVINNCVFEECTAQVGGAIHIMRLYNGNGTVAAPYISNCTFRNNSTPSNFGGAIAMTVKAQPTIENCIFEDNHAGTYGGAIGVSDYYEDSHATIINCLFKNNTAAHGGGALSSGSPCSVIRSTFYGNGQTNGGTIYINAVTGVETLSLSRCIIANTTGGSGLKAATGASASFSCSDFWNNSGGDITGGLSPADVDDNTIFKNPYFCDAANGTYTIVENSPCAADYSPCGQQIGKYGVGCDAPGLEYTAPTTYQVGAPNHVEVLVCFDEPMDESTINSSTFKVYSRTGGQATGTYNFFTPMNWAWFSADDDYAAGDILSFTLTGEIESAAGFPINPFHADCMINVSDASFGTLGNQATYGAGTKPDGIFPADLDGDGDIDLVAPNHDSHNVSVFMNNGDGTFANDVLYAAGTNPWDVTAIDFDGDGDLDLATSNYGSNNMSILLNAGNGTFGAPTSYAAGDRPHPILAADLDGDGDYDVITANLISDDISVFFNNGDGTFADQITYGVAEGPIGLAGADYDNDGDVDIFVANYNTNLETDTVTLHENDGLGHLLPYQAISVGGDGPFNVIAVDLDGDRDVDLATANRRSDDVSVIIQNAQGGFDAPVIYGAGNDPYYVCPVDLNGDDRLDLVSANLLTDDLSVLINNGNGTYAAEQRYSVGDGPLWVCAADFNGDLMVDIAVANAFAHTISVLDNSDNIGPRLVSPTSGYSTYSHSITLNWDDLVGATSYEVIVDGDPNFGSIDRHITGLAASQWLISPNLGHGKFYWKVRAQTAGGPSSWSSVWYFTIKDYPTSCPVLFTNDGSQFIKDNPLLTACEKSGYADIVTDYYLVSQPVANRDGAVTFQLRELEDEVTSLYDLELLVVDHDSQSKIACAPDGGILPYLNTIAPVSAVDNLGRDQLATVSGQDDVRFESHEAGWLEVTFETPDEPLTGGIEGGIIIDVPPKALCPIDKEENMALRPAPDNDGADRNIDVTVEYKNAQGDWEILPAIPPRVEIGQEALMMPIESDVITIRVSWKEFYSTDVIEYFVPSDEQPRVTNHAIKFGSVSLSDQKSDWTGFTKSEPLVLHKGDVFEFTFQTGDLPAEGTKRDYIIRSVGRYQPDYDIFTRYAPTEPQLHGNFPNPFNPTTTISYDLPSEAQVSLVVYNVLGQEVTTLVNDRQGVGSYEVVWSGKDGSGTPVSSGIYFYKLTVGDFAVSKKMLLLK